MRKSDIVDVPAGGQWPGNVHENIGARFCYVLVDNRGASDVFVGTHRMITSDPHSYDRKVPAGTQRTWSIGDTKGEMPEELHIANPGIAATTVLYSVSDQPIHDEVVSESGNPIVTSNDLTDGNAPLGQTPTVMARLEAVDVSTGNYARLRIYGSSVDGGGVGPYLITASKMLLQTTRSDTGIVEARTPAVFKPLNAIAIGAEAPIWAPAAGKKFRVMGFLLNPGVAPGTVILRDGVAGTVILRVPLPSLNFPVDSPPMGNGILSAVANNVLTAQGVATETLDGFVFGTEE